MWSCAVWSSVVWSGLARSGLVRSGVVWSGPVRCVLVWSGPVSCGLVWSGPVRSGVVWSGLVSHTRTSSSLYTTLIALILFQLQQLAQTGVEYCELRRTSSRASSQKALIAVDGKVQQIYCTVLRSSLLLIQLNIVTDVCQFNTFS